MNIALFSKTGTVSYINTGTASVYDTIVGRFQALLLSYYDDVTQQGTSLLSQLRSGQIMSSAAVQSRFTLAVAQVLQQMGGQSEFPTSQQIQRVDLSSYTLASGRLDMTILLVMADKTTKITSQLSLQ